MCIPHPISWDDFSAYIAYNYDANPMITGPALPSLPVCCTLKQEVLNQVTVTAWDDPNPKTPSNFLAPRLLEHLRLMAFHCHVPPTVKPASLVTCSGTERSGIPHMSLSQCQSDNLF